MRTLLLALVTTAPLLASTYPFPILEMRLGGMDHPEKGLVISKTCDIYEDHKSLSGKKLNEVLESAGKLEKAVMNHTKQYARQIPSIEISVNIPTRIPGGPAVTRIGSRKVLLLQSSGTMETRDGAEDLIEFVKDVCKDLK